MSLQLVFDCVLITFSHNSMAAMESNHRREQQQQQQMAEQEQGDLLSRIQANSDLIAIPPTLHAHGHD